MGFRGWVAGLFGGGVTEVCECRECGTSLGSSEERCPHCGPTDVVRFELPE